MVDVDVLARARSRVGEGPVWYRGRLHWVDILAGEIHSTGFADGGTAGVCVPTWVGAAIPLSDGGYVAATREGFAAVIDGHLETFSAFLPDGVRMNDAKCDPAGRLWAGSCAEDFARGAGALHCLDPDWSHRIAVEGLTQPNGIGWSPDARTMYLIDTQDAALYAYDFAIESGSLGERRVVIRFDVEQDGYPDGLAVDAEGCIWIAMWGGGGVVRVSPAGVRLTRIDIPAAQTSSCAFVGAGLDALCVTTASEGLDREPDTLDGSVFLVSGLGVAGTPVATFAGRWP